VPRVDPRSTGGQIAEAFALVTHPFAFSALTLTSSFWAPAALSAQWESDVVGGGLLGATVASGALWLSGVDTIRRSIELRGLPAGHPDKRAAIIDNPTKVLDLPLFRRRVDHALLHSGWKPPLWLETTREDPGRRMARDALAHDVDLVLVAGGDGTVRAGTAPCAQRCGSCCPANLLGPAVRPATRRGEQAGSAGLAETA